MKNEYAKRWARVCCGASAIAAPTVLTLEPAQATPAIADANGRADAGTAAEIAATDTEARIPQLAAAPAVSSPAAPTFTPMAQSAEQPAGHGTPAAMAPVTDSLLQLEGARPEGPQLEGTEVAPKDTVVSKDAAVSTLPPPAVVPARPVEVPASTPTPIPAPTPARAPSEISNRPISLITEPAESAAVTVPPTEASPDGTAADLNAGEPYAVSWTADPSTTPRYDLEISAAQLTPETASPAATLDPGSVLDRLGLQFDGVQTGTEVAQLEVDYADAAGQSGGQARTTRYMANADYEISTGSNLRPYIGGGIGYANIATRPDSPTVERTTETRFAYQLRAGMRYEVAPQVTLNMGYRYFAVPGQVQLGARQQAISSSAVEFGVQARF